MPEVPIVYKSIIADVGIADAVLLPPICVSSTPGGTDASPSGVTEKEGRDVKAIG